jgi:hypothetical protein
VRRLATIATLLVGLAYLGCRADPGGVMAGRWQGGSRPPSEPISIAVTLRSDGDSLRGWGVARTDGGSFPIAARGAAGQSDSGRTITLWLSPWRAGVVDVSSAQVYGTLNRNGAIRGSLRTDAGLGIGFGTPIELQRP